MTTFLETIADDGCNGQKRDDNYNVSPARPNRGSISRTSLVASLTPFRRV